jgi:rare lipoprotein A
MPGTSIEREVQVGLASYYDSKFHGEPTASGERYDERALTAAHRTLPFGTRVQVTNLSNGRSVVVTITDRGPFARGRVIDVSRRAARRLGFLRDGTTRVRLEVVD